MHADVGHRIRNSTAKPTRFCRLRRSLTRTNHLDAIRRSNPQSRLGLPGLAGGRPKTQAPIEACNSWFEIPSIDPRPEGEGEARLRKNRGHRRPHGSTSPVIYSRRRCGFGPVSISVRISLSSTRQGALSVPCSHGQIPGFVPLRSGQANRPWNSSLRSAPRMWPHQLRNLVWRLSEIQHKPMS